MRTQYAGLMLVALSLTACDTGSPAFYGIEAQTVTIGTSTFAVRRKGDVAELVRTNSEAVFSLAGIVPRAAEAVKVVTGCTPRPGTWTGDHAIARVQLDCPS